MMKSTILFFTPYPHDRAASQRFRFEQYYDLLKDNGFEIRCQSFIDKNTWEILYNEGYAFKKTIGLLKGFAHRLWVVLTAWQYDFIFIHRETAPLGPPIFEWYLTKVLRKNVIYDFDDAIWIESTSASNTVITKLKWAKKIKSICRWSYKVSCGNKFLADYAANFNSHVVINPTTLDTEHLHIPKAVDNSKPVIGWTGTHSTLKYLKIILEPLRMLSKKHEFDFLVIADKQPDFEIPNLRFTPWNKTTEVDDLNLIDIGVMPLEDDSWAKGKCGFKALQFMALEKPVVVSPVGVNIEIIEEGENGFLAKDESEWVSKLSKLIESKELRERVGQNGRETVLEKFSVQANREKYLEFFNELLD